MDATVQVPAEALRLLVEVAAHVSRGRSAVDVGRYPDAVARRALGALDDAGLIGRDAVPPPVRVAIDPNVRVFGNQGRAGFEDASGPAKQGDQVQVFAEETGLHALAVVTEVDEKRRLLWLSLDWSALASHEDCRACDVLDPCPCCGLRYVNGRWVRWNGEVA